MPKRSSEEKARDEYQILMSHWDDLQVDRAIDAVDTAEEHLAAIVQHSVYNTRPDRRAKLEQALDQLAWLRETLLAARSTFVKPPAVRGPKAMAAEARRRREQEQGDKQPA
jgi:hypothetical protein